MTEPYGQHMWNRHERREEGQPPNRRRTVFRLSQGLLCLSKLSKDAIRELF